MGTLNHSSFNGGIRCSIVTCTSSPYSLRLCCTRPSICGTSPEPSPLTPTLSEIHRAAQGFLIKGKTIESDILLFHRPMASKESSPCTTAAHDSQETPWSLCIISHPEALGRLRTRHRCHWCQKSGLIIITMVKSSSDVTTMAS